MLRRVIDLLVGNCLVWLSIDFWMPGGLQVEVCFDLVVFGVSAFWR